MNNFAFKPQAAVLIWAVAVTAGLLLVGGAAFAQGTGQQATVAEAASATQPLPDDANWPLTGRVEDEAGNPLAGATVTIGGDFTSRMCITNAAGGYLLRVPAARGRLTVSFAGYQSQIIELGLDGTLRAV